MRPLNVAPVIVSLALSACAGHGPLRVAMEPSDRINELCKKLYTDTDAQIATIAADYTLDFSARSRKLEDLEKHMRQVTAPDHMDCWKTSYENHADYDLFYAEFDDSGNATDVNAGTGTLACSTMIARL